MSIIARILSRTKVSFDIILVLADDYLADVVVESVDHEVADSLRGAWVDEVGPVLRRRLSALEFDCKKDQVLSIPREHAIN